MAKSIRSKWKIKMRNIKRQKNYQLELNRLKSTISTLGVDAIMDSVAEVKDRAIDECMDTSTTSKTFNKHLLDENGRYPDWLSKKDKVRLRAKRLKKNPKNKKIKRTW